MTPCTPVGPPATCTVTEAPSVTVGVLPVAFVTLTAWLPALVTSTRMSDESFMPRRMRKTP